MHSAGLSADPNVGDKNAFGNGTFNTPSLIEAADTAPFFHDAIEINSKGVINIDNAVTFYANVAFTSSVAARQLEERFGTPLVLSAEDSGKIARFLRVLNAVLNVDIATQRLDAASTLADQLGDERADVQLKLLELSRVEVDDALDDLNAGGSAIYPVAVEGIQAARVAIEAGLAAGSAGDRQNAIDDARASMRSIRGEFGTHVDFQLGEGNLMY